jgi:hypothetical protein
LAVRWEVAIDPEMLGVVACGTEIADESSDYTIKVDVRELRPFTDYYYRFETLSMRSRIGHTKTLPEGATEHVRIGVCSCAKYTSGYFNAYARMAERADLDLVVHLGDYIYEVGTYDGKAPARRSGTTGAAMRTIVWILISSSCMRATLWLRRSTTTKSALTAGAAGPRGTNPTGTDGGRIARMPRSEPGVSGYRCAPIPLILGAFIETLHLVTWPI